MNLRTIARMLLAALFIVEGWDSLQRPKAKAGTGEEMTAPVAKKMGLPDDPVELVKLNGAVQLGGGVMLAVGWLPRLAATVLGATLIPSTISASRSWEGQDPEQRRSQMLHALKNGSILGGLIMTALDHGGRPSVFWMTRKAAGRTSDLVSGAVEKVTR